ncbi:MAG TPA: tRNA pseudouridine(38-40) synthase TruA [Thermoanaerobaculia bacterium]|nr:tRNA pseudouridine(38-40) synthase TruA [Thermoanaerobaculia bacterium]
MEPAFYRLTLAYRGTAYAGWQRQINALTVQEVVERGLAAALGREVGVVGAGRTDAGVHARGQVAHLELPAPFPLKGLVFGTNAHLPEDVRILQAAAVPVGFHARRHALTKLYRYRLVRAPVLSPLDALFSLRVEPRIDLAAMRAAVSALPGEHDFRAFALTGGAPGPTVRRILAAEIAERGAELVFAIEGEGFLRGMVRSLVGTLLEVGRGRREPSAFAALLEGAERSRAGPTAPPQGLSLELVRYGPQWDPLEPPVPAGSL